MRAAWIAAAAAAVALAAGALGACSSSDVAPTDDGGADAAPEAAVDPCSLFTDAGEPCTVVTRTACFPMCASGGCFCLEGPNGSAPRWTCTIDTSCLPDGSPLDDAGATEDDGGDAGPGDASDAGDASNDAADASG